MIAQNFANVGHPDGMQRVKLKHVAGILQRAHVHAGNMGSLSLMGDKHVVRVHVALIV